MSNFDQLHPALQHHIVNSLGWRRAAAVSGCRHSLGAWRRTPGHPGTHRGRQDRGAPSFPLMSRMLTEGWSGLSILYICPIKALLNNLDVRLERYCSLVGRRSTLWHGDVKPSARRRILARAARLSADNPRVTGGDAGFGRRRLEVPLHEPSPGHRGRDPRVRRG